MRGNGNFIFFTGKEVFLPGKKEERFFPSAADRKDAALRVPSVSRCGTVAFVRSISFDGVRFLPLRGAE